MGEFTIFEPHDLGFDSCDQFPRGAGGLISDPVEYAVKVIACGRMEATFTIRARETA